MKIILATLLASLLGLAYFLLLPFFGIIVLFIVFFQTIKYLIETRMGVEPTCD